MSVETQSCPVDPDLCVGPMGLALLGGRLVATVRSKKSGAHVTVACRVKAKDDGKWRQVPLRAATRIYLDVPTQDGPGRSIGTLHLEGTYKDSILPPWSEDFDAARVWAAVRVLDAAQGRASMEDDVAEVLMGQHCFSCGAELTDPESIERGLGPTCAERATESQHHKAGDEDFGASSSEEGGRTGHPAEHGAVAPGEDNSSSPSPEEQLAMELGASRQGAGSEVEEREEELPTQRDVLHGSSSPSTPVPPSASERAPDADGLVLLDPDDDPRELLRSLREPG